MKPFLALLIVLVGATVAAPQAYRWTDEKGTIHFSDKPIHADDTAQKILRQSPPADIPPRAPRSAPLTAAPPQRQEPQSRAAVQPSPAVQQPAVNPRFISAADYSITAGARQEKDQIIISGRVSGGPECANLIIKAYATTPSGGIVSGTAAVGSVGGNLSRTFSMTARTWETTRQSWTVTSLYASCL